MNTEKNKRIDEIINSLDGVTRMEAPDFFYTRLVAKMQAQNEGREKAMHDYNKRIWILRPVYAVAVLVLVLIINAFILFNNKEDEPNNAIASDNETLQQSIVSEYSLADNNSVYDLNSDK